MLTRFRNPLYGSRTMSTSGSSIADEVELPEDLSGSVDIEHDVDASEDVAASRGDATSDQGEEVPRVVMNEVPRDDGPMRPDLIVGPPPEPTPVVEDKVSGEDRSEEEAYSDEFHEEDVVPEEVDETPVASVTAEEADPSEELPGTRDDTYGDDFEEYGDDDDVSAARSTPSPPARDPPRETTPTTHETLIDGKVMAGAWLCEWRDDDARPEIFDRYKKNNAAAKVTSFGAMLALETDGDCEDGRVRLRSTPVNVDADQLIHSKLYAASVSVSASTASGRVVAEMSTGHSKPSVFFNGRALTETEREDVQWPATCVLEGGWRGTDGTGGWMRMCRVSRGWLETRWFESMGFPRRFNAVKKMRAAVHAVRAHGFFVAAAAAASRERAMKTTAAFDDLDFVDEEVSAE